MLPPVTRTRAAYFSCTRVEEQRTQYETLSLSAEEALDFYQNAVLPDLERGTLGRKFLLADGRGKDLQSNVEFHLELLLDDHTHDGLYLTIGMDSEACLAWLAEHTELPVFPQRQLFQETSPAPAVPDLAAP